MNALLGVDGLGVHYRGALRPALARVDFSLVRGQCVAVVGESGSGKSSLAAALLGLLPPGTGIEGRLQLDGEAHAAADVNQLARWRGRRIGMAFQDPLASLHPLRSVGDQLVEAIASLRGLRRAAAEAVARTLAAEVGLEDLHLLARHPHRLSGGQRQRVGIALALAGAPDVLLADEITSALDPPRALEIVQLLRGLCDARGLGVLFIAHDLGQVARLADSVLVLRGGCIEELGAVADVLRAPRSAHVRALLACRPRLHGNPSRLPSIEGAALPSALPHAAAATVATAPPALQLREVSVRHPGAAHDALAGIELSVARGEILGVVGVSGAGKSTLLRLVPRLLRPAAGSLWIDGEDLGLARGSDLRRLRRRIGMVFQDPAAALDPRATVRECVLEPLRAAGLREWAVLDARAAALLDDVGLDRSLLARPARLLSGGQQQRVSIARALAADPALLVCDEAVSALDAGSAAQVLNLLKDLCDRRALAIVFVSHDLCAVSFLCDRVLVLDGGRIVEQGPTADVLGAPHSLAAQRLRAAMPAD